MFPVETEEYMSICCRILLFYTFKIFIKCYPGKSSLLKIRKCHKIQILIL